jgi:hypothetical protein
MDGGAIDNGDNAGRGTVIVSMSTFSGNSASDGGAIDNGDHRGGGTVSDAADMFGGSCDQVGGTWDDEGYNVGSDGTCLSGGSGDVNHGASLTSLLGPLANNGGPTKTMLPLTGNPALGAVPDNTSVTLDGSPVTLCPTTDERGTPSTPGQACDAGAVQVPTAPS